MRDMIYGEAPSFETIINSLTSLEKTLNNK